MNKKNTIGRFMSSITEDNRRGERNVMMAYGPSMVYIPWNAAR